MKLTGDEQILLLKAIYNALFSSLKDLKQTEPQLVANIVKYLPNEINNMGIPNISSGGVFVHQLPQVKYLGASSSVEIGDLLILRTEKSNDTIISRSALLLQAKKIDSFGKKPDNIIQHNLYNNWPEFEYTRASKDLKGECRKIEGTDLHSASKYLLIGNSASVNLNNQIICFYKCFVYDLNKCITSCIFTAQPSFPLLSHHMFFIEEIYRFIIGDSGKRYQLPVSTKSRNWDRVIEDIIELTKESTSKYVLTAGGNGALRQQGLFCFITGNPLSFITPEMVDASLYHKDDNPPDVPKESSNNEEDSGVPIIEFVINTERNLNE